MKFDVSRFEEYREGNRLEAKKAKDSLPQNLWDTYSAMANCYGGVILLGVTENSDGSFSATSFRKTSGIRSTIGKRSASICLQMRM